MMIVQICLLFQKIQQLDIVMPVHFIYVGSWHALPG